VLCQEKFFSASAHLPRESKQAAPKVDTGGAQVHASSRSRRWFLFFTAARDRSGAANW
jgi:hypothetical protein